MDPNGHLDRRGTGSPTFSEAAPGRQIKLGNAISRPDPWDTLPRV